MMKIAKSTLLPLAAFLLASPALGGATPVQNRNCPSIAGTNKWRDWLAGRIALPPKWTGAVVGVSFHKGVDPQNAEGISIRPDLCYAVKFVTNPYGGDVRGYWSSRSFYQMSGPDTKGGLPGNPDEYEINVYGAMFLFDDDGRVFDSTGREVGRLSCLIYYGTHCGRR